MQVPAQPVAPFLPEGARARWPFVIGKRRAHRAAGWRARPLLLWGVLEALLRLQAQKPSRYWESLSDVDLSTFMHAGEVGVVHPSRRFAAELIGVGESILDVGCGPGVNYEVLASLGRAAGYVGVDSTARAVEIARARYPRGDFRVGDAERIVRAFGERSFDIVLVRHVLEHLPDFQPVLSQAIAVARSRAVLVFFLTPRALPFGVRKVNLRIQRGRFYNVYSQAGIEKELYGLGVSWTWRLGLGQTRAGWYAGEVNSALVVSRPAS